MTRVRSAPRVLYLVDRGRHGVSDWDDDYLG